MGLRCSILGHTFDETEVRRDRRERGSGNEVITVVSQVERCSKCGTERVVSENKEVVSVVDADEVGLEAGETADAGGSRPSTSADDAVGDTGSGSDSDSGPPSGSGAAQDPSPVGDDPDPDPMTGSAPADAEEGTGAEAGAEPDSAEEDVEFITETEGSLGGGEDVAEDTDVPDEAGAGAGDAGGGVGGMAARSGAFDGSDDDRDEPDEDAEILDAPETERAPGQWPDEPDGDEPWEPGSLDEDTGEDGPDEGATADPAPEVEPLGESSFTVPEGSLACPDCGHEVSTDSSFRAGDACPECQRGYLEDAAE